VKIQDTGSVSRAPCRSWARHIHAPPTKRGCVCDRRINDGRARAHGSCRVPDIAHASGHAQAMMTPHPDRGQPLSPCLAGQPISAADYHVWQVPIEAHFLSAQVPGSRLFFSLRSSLITLSIGTCALLSQFHTSHLSFCALIRSALNTLRRASQSVQHHVIYPNRNYSVKPRKMTDSEVQQGDKGMRAHFFPI
jgi:hypothetical protein